MATTPKPLSAAEKAELETARPPEEWADEKGWDDASADDGYEIDLSRPFEGIFVSRREIPHPETGEVLQRLVFEDMTGERCSCWPGHQLKQSFEKIEPGEQVRIMLVGFKDTGSPSKMKLYKVLHRKVGTEREEIPF